MNSQINLIKPVFGLDIETLKCRFLTSVDRYSSPSRGALGDVRGEPRGDDIRAHCAITGLSLVTCYHGIGTM